VRPLFVEMQYPFVVVGCPPRTTKPHFTGTNLNCSVVRVQYCDCRPCKWDRRSPQRLIKLLASRWCATSDHYSITIEM